MNERCWNFTAETLQRGEAAAVFKAGVKAARWITGRRCRGGRRPLTSWKPIIELQGWAREWLRYGADKKKLRERTIREWEDWWHDQASSPAARRLRAGAAAAEFNPSFRISLLRKVHQRLAKHESSALTQLRTGCVGLRSFLYSRGVPVAPTPFCRCGSGEETVYHILAEYALSRDRPAHIPLRSQRDAVEALSSPRAAGTLTRWFLRDRKPEQFRLAVSL
jgi:hypothetical protein